MKLTRRQLRKIIFESLNNDSENLNEFFGFKHGPMGWISDKVKSALKTTSEAAKEKYPDAWDLFYSMHGGIVSQGVNEKLLQKIIDKRSGDLPKLYDEYEMMAEILQSGTPETNKAGIRDRGYSRKGDLIDQIRREAEGTFEDKDLLMGIANDIEDALESAGKQRVPGLNPL